MPRPVFGAVGSVGTPMPYPSATATITRGASDTFAVGGGLSTDATDRTATYGGVSATRQIEGAIGSFYATLFSLANPLSGAQSWTVAGPTDNFGAAVATYSGLDVSPIRGVVVSSVASGTTPVTYSLAGLTADEIGVAYVGTIGTADVVLGAGGDTIIRAQGSNSFGYGFAIIESPTGVFDLTRSVSVQVMFAAAILTGAAGGGVNIYGRLKRRR